MNISVACSRLSDNTFVRSYLLLQTLPEADITVYGLVDDEGLYPFFDDETFDFQTIRSSHRRGRVGTAMDMLRLWRKLIRVNRDTDLLYVASGWKDNVIPAITARRSQITSGPKLLDVYDYTPWFDRLAIVKPPSWFDAVIASNSPLAKRVGGKTIYTPVDTNRFDPANYNRNAIRQELGFRVEDTVLGFIGTPRRSKGVHHLIEAVNQSQSVVKGLIVGAGTSGYISDLRSQANDDNKFVKPVPHSEIPRYYAAIDMLVLPQEPSPLAEYQIPAKLFESMSMRRPVIGTAIGDMESIIDDTGATISDPSAESILGAVERMRACGIEKLGKLARNRAINHYSNKIAGERLSDIIRMLVGTT